ncbi:hypothetical protein C8R45DRAFT_967304 [Mycena sanguinolenta]|nr:hypothetical protein C8R45DRAFT_967304 [Mycena sanguinolenta]
MEKLVVALLFLVFFSETCCYVADGDLLAIAPCLLGGARLLLESTWVRSAELEILSKGERNVEYLSVSFFVLFRCVLPLFMMNNTFKLNSHMDPVQLMIRYFFNSDLFFLHIFPVVSTFF